MQLTKGQPVRIRRAGTDDEWSPGTVEVASASGKAIGLWLEAAVRTGDGGFIAGALPLFVDHEKHLLTGLFGDEYEIEIPAE